MNQPGFRVCGHGIRTSPYFSSLGPFVLLHPRICSMVRRGLEKGVRVPRCISSRVAFDWSGGAGDWFASIAGRHRSSLQTT